MGDVSSVPFFTRPRRPWTILRFPPPCSQKGANLSQCEHPLLYISLLITLLFLSHCYCGFIPSLLPHYFTLLAVERPPLFFPPIVLEAFSMCDVLKTFCLRKMASSPVSCLMNLHFLLPERFHDLSFFFQVSKVTGKAFILKPSSAPSPPTPPPTPAGGSLWLRNDSLLLPRRES